MLSETQGKQGDAYGVVESIIKCRRNRYGFSCIIFLSEGRRKEVKTLNGYSAQKKHIRTHYARFPLDLRPEVLEEFKKACADNGTTPTTEIKKFIAAYCEAARDK